MLFLLNRYHRSLILIILILISIFSWFYTIAGVGMNMSAWQMTLMNLNLISHSNSMEMMEHGKNYNIFLDFILLFFMWFFMMTAMMLPSVIPFVIMFQKINEERKKLQYQYVATFNFALSYIAVWGLFSFLATFIHLILKISNVLNSHTMSIGYLLGGILFILAGIYQMTPLKDSCLYYCRNPIELFSSNKIFSNWSAFYVGLKHGFFCVGCCWVLMLLLFYVGVMNLFWIAGLSIYIILEKYFFRSKKMNYISGILIIFWGIRIFYVNFS